MENKLKQINPLIIIAIVILLIIIVASTIYLFTNKPKIKETNDTPELIHLKFDDIVKSNILFSDIKIYKQDKYFYLNAKATNMTSNILKITPITITLKDNSGKTTNLISYIGDTLNAEDSQSITVKTNEDLKNTVALDINMEVQVQS